MAISRLSRTSKGLVSYFKLKQTANLCLLLQPVQRPPAAYDVTRLRLNPIEKHEMDAMQQTCSELSVLERRGLLVFAIFILWLHPLENNWLTDFFLVHCIHPMINLILFKVEAIHLWRNI